MQRFSPGIIQTETSSANKTGKGCINFSDSNEINYVDLELAIRHAIICAKT